MKMLKNVGAVILVMAMVVSSLTGCGNKPETDATVTNNTETTNEADTSAEENKTDGADMSGTTITYMASQDWVQDAELKLGEKFTEQTGIKVDYQIVPADQYENLLLTKLNTGECADLFGAQSGYFNIKSQINVEKNAVDLSQESWAANLEKGAAAELTVDGKLYGQPAQDVSSVWAMAYNKAIFEELGLEIPKNYEEFKGVCDAILKAGKTPIYECVSDTWHHTLWTECGVAATKADPSLPEKLNNNTAVLADNAVLAKLMSQIKEMADAGYWGDNYMSNKYADVATVMATGDYVMAVGNQGLGAEINAIDSSFSADNIGYFVMPLCDNQSLNINACGPSRYIYSGSQNMDAAKKYLEFMASEESMQYMTDNVAKINKLPFTNAPSAYSDTIKDFYDRYPEQISVLQASVKYINPQWMDMGTDISALLLGEMSETDVLKDIDKRRAEQATAANDEAWAK